MDMSVDNPELGQWPLMLPRQGQRVAKLSPWQSVIQACVNLTPALGELLTQFWGVPVKLTFLGLSEKPHYFWRLDDFHVSQLQLAAQGPPPAENIPSACLRLSDALCGSLLSRVLGLRPPTEFGFSLRQLSPLEASILNEFSRDVLVLFKKQLLKKSVETSQRAVVQLLWVATLDESSADWQAVLGPAQAARLLDELELGKIVFSVPVDALKPTVSRSQPGPNVSDDFFFHVLVPARIAIGDSRVSLVDLEHLEPGDLIVLEDSRLDRMALIDPHAGTRLPFAVQINRPQVITMPYEQEFDEMDTPMNASAATSSARQNLWDNLMIEVNAEFEPIKLPLRQLKQMSEGLVIEIDDLLHNQVSLSVEGKILALGELIIVGDRFGVRVSRVLAPEETTPTGQALASRPPVAPEAAPLSPSTAPAGTSDEMNLENFLNDDFDEALDGEEEW